MTDSPHDKNRTELEEPEPVEHLSQLSVGDRVLFGDRSRALTVVNVGVREITDERLDDGTLETPIVRLQGYWKNAKTVELGHQINRMEVKDGDFQPVLEEMDIIVDFELGREKDLRRTHVVDDAQATAECGSSEVPA